MRDIDVFERTGQAFARFVKKISPDKRKPSPFVELAAKSPNQQIAEYIFKKTQLLPLLEELNRSGLEETGFLPFARDESVYLPHNPAIEWTPSVDPRIFPPLANVIHARIALHYEQLANTGAYVVFATTPNIAPEDAHFIKANPFNNDWQTELVQDINTIFATGRAYYDGRTAIPMPSAA